MTSSPESGPDIHAALAQSIIETEKALTFVHNTRGTLGVGEDLVSFSDSGVVGVLRSSSVGYTNAGRSWAMQAENMATVLEKTGAAFDRLAGIARLLHELTTGEYSTVKDQERAIKQEATGLARLQAADVQLDSEQSGAKATISAAIEPAHEALNLAKLSGPAALYPQPPIPQAAAFNQDVQDANSGVNEIAESVNGLLGRAGTLKETEAPEAGRAVDTLLQEAATAVRLAMAAISSLREIARQNEEPYTDRGMACDQLAVSILEAVRVALAAGGTLDSANTNGRAAIHYARQRQAEIAQQSE